MAKTKIAQETKEAKAVPIKWNIPDAMNSVYSQSVLVQVMENEFKIMFFELKPQPRLNKEDPPEKTVQANCVASVILHPQKVISLINALQRQLKVFVEREQEGAKLLSPPSAIAPEQPS